MFLGSISDIKTGYWISERICLNYEPFTQDSLTLSSSVVSWLKTKETSEFNLTKCLSPSTSNSRTNTSWKMATMTNFFLNMNLFHYKVYTIFFILSLKNNSSAWRQIIKMVSKSQYLNKDEVIQGLAFYE